MYDYTVIAPEKMDNRAQLFKTKEVLSYRIVKTLIIKYGIIR